MDKWLKQFIDNYEGKSKEAKSVEDFVKQNYKGNSYIPWATMERLTYMQDPNATFEVVKGEDGSIVRTDKEEILNEVTQDGIVKNKTISAMFSHFVSVKLTFLGKEFIEEYPIQDQDYSALKVYNQNAVNKALQRAKAKVASRGTGIGLKLYEGKDLQFDAPVEEEKPVVKKSTKKTTIEKAKEDKLPLSDIVENADSVEVEVVEVKSKVAPVAEIKEDAPVQEEVKQDARIVVSASYSNDVIELCQLIKSSPEDKMTKALQTLNVAILKQHGFTLNQTDDADMLCEKLSHFKDVTVFTRAINTMIK